LPDDEEAGVAGVATDGPEDMEAWLAETACPIREEAPEAPWICIFLLHTRFRCRAAFDRATL
jgi:hypothetical protein